MIRQIERRPRRHAVLLATLLGLGAASCVGPGLEPPGDNAGQDFGPSGPGITPPNPGAQPDPQRPVGMQPSTAGAAAPTMNPVDRGPERPADAGVAREEDAGTDDSGLER